MGFGNIQGMAENLESHRRGLATLVADVVGMMRERVLAPCASEQPEQSGTSMQRSTARMASEIFLFVLLVSGCARYEPLADFPSGRTATQETGAVTPSRNQSGISVAPANEPFSDQAALPDDFLTALAGQGRATAECFQLRPGGKGNKREKSRRCEPQSLPFARCRSGIDSCRIGHENGPLTWFACEKERGNTSLVPRPGSILILAANGRRKMPTGHVAYVEKVIVQNATVYRLTFTHTNYDRRCSLESNIEATYDSAARTLDIYGGAWQAWGKGLPVAGFILD